MYNALCISIYIISNNFYWFLLNVRSLWLCRRQFLKPAGSTRWRMLPNTRGPIRSGLTLPVRGRGQPDGRTRRKTPDTSATTRDREPSTRSRSAPCSSYIYLTCKLLQTLLFFLNSCWRNFPLCKTLCVFECSLRPNVLYLNMLQAETRPRSGVIVYPAINLLFLNLLCNRYMCKNQWKYCILCRLLRPSRVYAQWIGSTSNLHQAVDVSHFIKLLRNSRNKAEVPLSLSVKCDSFLNGGFVHVYILCTWINRYNANHVSCCLWQLWQ